MADKRTAIVKTDHTDGDVYGPFREARSGDKVSFPGELAVGEPGAGKEAIFGEGGSFTDNMVVITTDDTATSTTDGGNLTDVSADAASGSGSTFSFQDVDADHTILIGADITDLKHWGFKSVQTTAAAEVTPKSFVVEIWNGSAWVAVGTMSCHSTAFHRYGNELFIRSNISEYIAYGITDGTTWAKKTIDGHNLYWVRLRIDTTVTTAPVFEQFKLFPHFAEIEEDGTIIFRGSARHRITLNAMGNIFGEEGGVTHANIAVGSGGVPTGWDHQVKNSEFNSDGDAINFQFSLPTGIETASMLEMHANVIITDGGGASPANDATLIMSCLPVEIQGVLEADPSGGAGHTPVARTLANTETITAKAGVARTVTTVDTSDTTKIRHIEFEGFDISDYYAGDQIFGRLELDSDGAATADIVTLEVIVEYTTWTIGERI